MVGLLRGYDQRAAAAHEVDARVQQQIRLELQQVHSRRSAEVPEPHGRAVQIGVRETLHVQLATTDAVQSLILLHQGDLRFLEQRVRAQDGVVRLVSGRCDLRTCPLREAELRLLLITHGQASQKRK